MTVDAGVKVHCHFPRQSVVGLVKYEVLWVISLIAIPAFSLLKCLNAVGW